MGSNSEAGASVELESLRTEVAQLREIVAALVNLVVENQAGDESVGDFDDEGGYLPEVGTGSKFGWGM
jgi:hypothetical protein